ncbi:MAG TPA: tetratricopeptide repeat protein [Xanthobacteraceae bacterium]|nr:tetratricopeptide repeat protein [Xanthobacteraceae bacterium]
MNFRFTDFEINTERQELRRAGVIVHVEPQVFDLLVHLIQNRDRIVTKDELIDAIWHGRIVSEATLSSRINAARRALGDTGNDQSLIRTLYKRGFRFVGDVSEDTFAPAAHAIEKEALLQGAGHTAADLVLTGEPLPLPDESSVAVLSFQNMRSCPDQEHFADSLDAAACPPPTLSDRVSVAAAEYAALPGDRGADLAPVDKGMAPTGPRAARNLLFAGALISLASLLVTGAWLLSSPSPSPAASTQDAITLASKAESPADGLKAQVPSIVVLPFINLSGDAKRDYLADGITDSLISDLVRALPGISIVSRDTAFTYKGRGADARQIGRELGVRYLLAGSVVFEGERVRVNTQLAETKEGSQLWAERFDTERTSILQVQDEIVGRVSRAIGLKVVDIEARRSSRERPSSAELVDLIMRGKAVLNLPSSAATMIEARGLFEQALKVEPSNVDGLAGVATTLIFEFLNGYYETGGDKRLHDAELLLDRAVMLEPRHIMALKAKAALRRTQGKFDDAIAAAEAVVMENPGEPWAYKEIGLSTMYLGRPEQALDWYAKANRIGPRDPGRWTWLDGRGHALILLGRDEEAIHALISALDANPKNLFSHAFLAAAYAHLGRSDEARAALAAYLQRRPGATISTFRRLSPVPLALTSPKYQQQHERLKEGLRKAGMPE